MSKKIKPQKWEFVYPKGTKEGDEEFKLFVYLARNPKFVWRSVAALAKESKLTKERVEEILSKYYKKNMVFLNPKNDDQWGYWENCTELLPDIEESIAEKDKNNRIDRRLNKSK